MLLRTVKHLFLWAIYTMAMLVITRWYPSHWDKTIESVVYQFFFFRRVCEKTSRFFGEESTNPSPQYFTHSYSMVPNLWFHPCIHRGESASIPLRQGSCLRSQGSWWWESLSFYGSCGGNPQCLSFLSSPKWEFNHH